MGIVLRDGKDPWTARRHDKDGKVILKGEFTDVVLGETMEDQINRLDTDAQQQETT